MHKINKGAEPKELAQYREKNVPWAEFSQEPLHKEIGDILYERQFHYCAYCEVIVKEKQKGHIEHLERHRDNPTRVYDWENLFFSCKKLDSCGIYKDQKAGRFSINDIVDPSKEDPQEFFQYTVEGEIFPRAGLSVEQEQRAKETIRVFHLNCSRLIQLRKSTAKLVFEYIDYPDITDDEITDLLESLGPVPAISVCYSLLDRKMNL